VEGMYAIYVKRRNIMGVAMYDYGRLKRDLALLASMKIDNVFLSNKDLTRLTCQW
jgi:hypothetical protein